MSIFKSKLEKKVDKIAQKLESIKINEYVLLMNNTKKLMWRNFIAGIAKGFGSAIGFTILSAIIILFLRKLVVLNIPIIGKYLKDILDIAIEK